MQRMKRKILLATVLVTTVLGTAFVTVSAYAYVWRMTTGWFLSNFVLKTKPAPPDTFSLDILGDATGMYQFCEMFKHFTVMKLEWQGAFPSYPPPTKVYITLDVRSVSFEKTDTWTYHLSMKGLDEFSLAQDEETMFLAQARSGELNLDFSDEGHTLDITGTLSGDVHFIFNVPGIESFDYEGSQLEIDVHVRPRP